MVFQESRLGVVRINYRRFQLLGSERVLRVAAVFVGLTIGVLAGGDPAAEGAEAGNHTRRLPYTGFYAGESCHRDCNCCGVGYRRSGSPEVAQGVAPQGVWLRGKSRLVEWLPSQPSSGLSPVRLFRTPPLRFRSLDHLIALLVSITRYVEKNSS